MIITEIEEIHTEEVKGAGRENPDSTRGLIENSLKRISTPKSQSTGMTSTKTGVKLITLHIRMDTTVDGMTTMIS